MTASPASRSAPHGWDFVLTIPLVGLIVFALGLLARAWLTDGGVRSVALGLFDPGASRVGIPLSLLALGETSQRGRGGGK